jgi:arylsulfatase A-like enzyme
MTAHNQAYQKIVRSLRYAASASFRMLLVSDLMITLGQVFGLATETGIAAEATRRPNILLIVGDDMGYADVGFQGCADIPTPHLDALARDGVRFTSGYVSGPYCSPTRAGLMTGRYQQRFGHEFNPGQEGQGLPLTETTLADRLQKVGYRTALVGKWHLGSDARFHPQQRGFQEFFGFTGGAHDYFSFENIQRGTTPVKESSYLTDAIGREGCDFIRKNGEHPWFLYLAFNAVHTPMQADDTRLQKLKATGRFADPTRLSYAAMMVAMDDAIGQVRRTLIETNQANNTLIAFISDNGGPTMPGVTVNASRNTPLRGSKRTTLEGGIRVPFLMTWPVHLTPGVYNQPVIQLDLHATALAAAGILNDRGISIDGVNLLRYLQNQSAANVPHDALYWRFGDQMAIRKGGWKLVRYDKNADTLSGERNQGVTAAKLYDLTTDIGESRDLAESMPEKTKELQQAWNQWNAGLVAPLWQR